MKIKFDSHMYLVSSVTFNNRFCYSGIWKGSRNWYGPL